MDISIKVTYKNEGLQKLRKAAGLSQSQLADLAGIKVQVLQQYERGARDINGEIGRASCRERVLLAG